MKLSDFDFRIWDNKKEYIKAKCDFLCISKKDAHEDLYRILDVAEDCSGYDMISYDDYSDDRFEVELWTGLYDKNDNKIYEGDILKLYHFGQKFIGIVKFGKDGFVLTSKIDEDASQGAELTYYEKYYYDFEVIGNIHENEDLFKD